MSEASDGGQTEMAALGDKGVVTRVRPGAHGGAGRGAQISPGGAGRQHWRLQAPNRRHTYRPAQAIAGLPPKMPIVVVLEALAD